VELGHWILLGVCAPLFFAAVARWRMCTQNGAERIARRDTTILVALLMLGIFGDAARSRFPDVSIPYLVISVALIPVAIAAIVLLVRLIKAYRRSRDVDSAGPERGARG